MARVVSALVRSPSKYHAQPTIVDNIRFASKKEAQRYQELRLLEKAGEIHHLELQPKYPLIVESLTYSYPPVQLGTYIADFRYKMKRRGDYVIEDVKGYDVPLGRWKRRHAEAQYGIQVTIIK